MSVTFYVKMSESCNLQCDHCSNAFNSNINASIDIDQTIAFIRSLNGRYLSAHFILTGGEPTIAGIDKLKDFVLKNNAFKDQTYSIQTNLVYNLTPQHLDFFDLICKDYGLGTSFDGPLRFKKESDKKRWERNVLFLSKKYKITVLVSINKWLIKQDPKKLLKYFNDIGISYFNIQQITPTGNAIDLELPTVEERDRWLFSLLESTTDSTIPKNMLFDSLVRGISTNKPSGTRTRTCQRRIYTINPDGTVKGCQNTSNTWGTINDNNIVGSIQRKTDIFKECLVDERCKTCDMYKYCSGDCHLLSNKECHGYYELLKEFSKNIDKYAHLVIEE